MWVLLRKKYYIFGYFVTGASRVYLACRSVERGEAAAAEIGRRVPDGTLGDRLPVLHLDLSSIKSVKNFVQEFKKRKYI